MSTGTLTMGSSRDTQLQGALTQQSAYPDAFVSVRCRLRCVHSQTDVSVCVRVLSMEIGEKHRLLVTSI